MPVYEYCCVNLDCDVRGERAECFLWHHFDKTPFCQVCGQHTARLISNFNAPFTGNLDRHDDPSIQKKNDINGGHWVTKIRSSELPDGQPERVLITNRQEQIAYCKAEGLIPPEEINHNARPDEDGLTSNSTGLPGTWGSIPPTMSQDTSNKRERPVFSGTWETENAIENPNG